MTYQIDKNVPLPPRRNSNITATLRKLEVGDSVFMQVGRTGVYSQAARIGIKITVQSTVENGKSGIRIWRTV